MRKMKASGVEWIGEIPEEWITIKIKYVAFLKGRIGWQGLTSAEYQDKGAYLITGTDFENGFINWQNCVHITEQRYNEDVLLHVREGDLLITKDGTIGKLAIVTDCPQQVTLNSGVMYIRSTGKYKYINKFLYYVLTSDIFWNWYTISQRGNSTIKHLYQEQFYNFSFPFPPLTEQIKIASYLDDKCSRIDALITAHRKIIERLRAYKSSLITEAVSGKFSEGWSVKKIKYLGIQSNVRADNTNNYIGLENIESKTGKYISGNEEFKPEGLTLKVDAGDVIFGKLRPYLAKSYFVEKSGCASTEFIVIKPTMCNGKYLKYLMLSQNFINIVNMSTYGSKMPRTNWDFVGNIQVPVPPLPEQIKIASYLDGQCSKIDSNIRKRELIIEKLSEYKKSLIYEAVTGKKEI